MYYEDVCFSIIKKKKKKKKVTHCIFSGERFEWKSAFDLRNIYSLFMLVGHLNPNKERVVFISFYFIFSNIREYKHKVASQI